MLAVIEPATLTAVEVLELGDVEVLALARCFDVPELIEIAGIIITDDPCLPKDDRRRFNFSFNGMPGEKRRSIILETQPRRIHRRSLLIQQAA